MIRLLELRTEKGLSQREMARELQVSQGTYNNWENGRTQPSIEQLILLSNFFSVSVDYLVGNTDEYGMVCVKLDITEEEKTLLKHFRSLRQDAKDALLQFLNTAK
ncbi:MAG: helix-turn-helix transcriptional regulator [Clostridia bacterium]|nr:helix-turn-helix transcriptional regulator [Clostridia bacterium]